jgi:hypothetical protein
MSESMRERIAQALEARFDELGLGCDWSDYADAVLDALREPTKAMVDAAEVITDSYYSEDDDFKRGWQAAIDAA